jgi:hypothetical protein
VQSEADRELESQDRAFKLYARCYMLTTAAANEISRKYPQIRDFNPDDVKRWATIDVISDLNRHGTDAVRPAIEGPPIEDQPFYESLLNSDWSADPTAAAAYSAHLVANPNDAAGAKAAGQAATMTAINAVAAGVANAVLPVPYTNEQLHYLYGSAGSAAYFDNFTKKHKEYVNSNHKLWGYIEEACSKQRDITAYINKRFDDLAPAERVQLPGNTLLNEIVVHFHRDTEREQMHSREIFYQTMLIHSAYDTALELEDCAFNLRKRGVEVSDNELRDRLLVCMENSVKYRELAGIITTRMRFSIPNPGAAPGPHHGVTWKSLKREVRNYDLDQGNIVNKRSQRRRASEFTSRVPRGHSRNTFLNTRSRSRSGSRGRSRSRSRERSSDYSSRIRSNSPYRYANSATSDSNGQSSSRQKSPSGERQYRSPSPHPQAQSSTTSRSKLVCKICNKVGHRPDQCRLRSRSSGSNRGRSPSRNVTFDSILKKAIRCFLCGQEHRVKDCPLKTKFMAEQRANMAIASTPEESYDSEDITEETIAENYASMLFALHSLTRGTFLDSGSSADSLPQLVDDDDDDFLPSLIDECPNKKQRLVSPETVPSVNDIFVSESISKKIQISDSASEISSHPSNFTQISDSISNISKIDSVVADYKPRKYTEEYDSASVQEVDNSFKLHLTPAIAPTSPSTIAPEISLEVAPVLPAESSTSVLAARILSDQLLVRREEISSDFYNKSTKLATNAVNCAYRRGYPNYFCLCCRVGYMGPYCTIVMEARMDHISASNGHPENPSDEPAILSPMLTSDLNAANEITYVPDSLPSETAANTTESELVEDRVSESPEKRRRSERVDYKYES